MPHITSDDLAKLTSRKGYGIVGGVGKGLKGGVGGKDRDSGPVLNVESGGGYESLREEAVQINYAGRAVVRVTFYRRRLADYGAESSRANCEKYILDGLTYAGLIRDDSGTEIRLEDGGQVKVETNEEERVEVEIRYQGVDYDNLWEKKTKFGNATK